MEYSPWDKDDKRKLRVSYQPKHKRAVIKVDFGGDVLVCRVNRSGSPRGLAGNDIFDRDGAWEAIKCWLVNDAEVGDEITITREEMTQKEIEELPEFMN